MQTRILGTSGLEVGAIGVGLNPMASYENRPALEDAALVLVRAAECGVTLWDTADAYCLNDSDIGYGEWLAKAALDKLPASLRANIVVATKGGTVRPEGGWEQDCSPQHLRAAIDASLKALQTEAIDLYQMHRPDDKVAFADSVGALAQAKQQGKIKNIGLSNVSAAQIDEALRITSIASVQNSYGFSNRTPETDGTLQKCKERGLAFLPFCPLNGVAGAKSLGSLDVLSEIAKESGASPQCVVLAWLLQKYNRIIPIPGVSRAASIEDSATAAELALSPAQIARLDNFVAGA